MTKITKQMMIDDIDNACIFPLSLVNKKRLMKLDKRNLRLLWRRIIGEQRIRKDLMSGRFWHIKKVS